MLKHCFLIKKGKQTSKNKIIQIKSKILQIFFLFQQANFLVVLKHCFFLMKKDKQICKNKTIVFVDIFMYSNNYKLQIFYEFRLLFK